MRCNTDHHTVNFIKGDKAELHHIAFELKDMSHMQNACEMFATEEDPILWGPVRHGPGHNVATYHRNPDEQTVEFFCELDQMKDEELGYFDPRPWHRDTPQRPKRAGSPGPPPIQRRGEPTAHEERSSTDRARSSWDRASSCATAAPPASRAACRARATSGRARDRHIPARRADRARRASRSGSCAAAAAASRALCHSSR